MSLTEYTMSGRRATGVLKWTQSSMDGALRVGTRAPDDDCDPSAEGERDADGVSVPAKPYVERKLNRILADVVQGPVA